MEWAIVVVALMALVGAVLGSAGAYAWANRQKRGAGPRADDVVRGPGQQPPVSAISLVKADPQSTAIRPAPQPAGSPVAPVAPVAPQPVQHTRPLPELPARPVPAGGRPLASVHPMAPVAPTPPTGFPVPDAGRRRRPAPGAAGPAVRGRGPLLRNGDQIAVHLPGGGVVRIGSGVIVGRADGCRLRFRASKVSRLHAVIYRTRGSWWLGDLGSTNGTTVDGVPVSGATPLHLGSHVRIGGHGGVGFTVRDAVESADIDSPSAA